MSHRACCHTCYSTQIMHYSHFKTQSFQHLKPIKCKKRVCKYKNPYMFRSFFTNIFRGYCASLCAVTLPPADLLSLSSYYYAVCGRMCMAFVWVWCSCLLVICLWSLQADHQQTRTPNTHRWHTHAALKALPVVQIDWWFVTELNLGYYLLLYHFAVWTEQFLKYYTH